MKRLLTFLFMLCSSPALAGITCVLPYNLQNNTTADANQVMANYNALVTCFTNAAAAGVNADITALNALVTPITPAQGGTSVYYGGTSTGSANAHVLAAPTPAGFTLTAGYQVTFFPGLNNTAATTLNVNGTGVKNLYKSTPASTAPTTGGELVVGSPVTAVYDGTQFTLISQPAQTGGFGPLTTAASSATVDLGAIPSHNVSITGVAAITSFGSSANTTFPVYRVTFAGILTLTYNATSLITPGTANITTAANDTAMMMYLGSGNWQVLNYTKATGVAIVNPTPLCGANGLVITNNTGTPNTSIDITADSAVMINATGNVPIYVTSVSVTINETTTGANGLDAGSLANNTFYYHWLISNGTATAGLSSTSSTAPTMPSGYIYKCRLGASKTNGSAIHYGFRQSGPTTQYVVGGANLTALPPIVTGTVGTNCTTATPTWSSLTVRGASGTAVWVPATATDVQVTAYSTGAGTASYVMVAPNGSYGGITSATDNQATIGVYTVDSTTASAISGWLKFEGVDTIAACAVETGRVVVMVQGWRDKVNAN